MVIDAANQQSIKESGSISRQALAWLRDHNLPADPICYYIAYELIHSSNDELKEQIKQISGSNNKRKQSIATIFDNFVVNKQERNFEQLSVKISQIAKLTLDSVSDTKGQISSYSNTLRKAAPLLSTSSESNPLDVINLLIEESNSVHQHALFLEKQLEKAGNEIRQLQDEHSNFKKLSTHDPLTKVCNRNGIKEIFDELSANQDNYPMAILMADIDHFKLFNDEYGHLVGDSVLCLVAAALKKNTKNRDVVGRFGGEEFIILLPKTNKANALSVAESLRKHVENLVIKKRNSDLPLKKITLSIGVSNLDIADDLDAGIEKADTALYYCKKNGRNCVNSD